MLTINKNNIERFFTNVLIAILVFIIFFQRCGTNHLSKIEPTVETKIDTVWKTKVDTITKSVKVFYTSHAEAPNIPIYQNSNNIDTCKTRFQKLLKNFTTKSVYKDTIKLNQLGTIEITDTVWLNKLQHRTYIQNIKIPTIEKTVTITKPMDPVRQLYIGGNLFTNTSKSTIIIPSLIYKDRHDRMFQINIGIDNKGFNYYGAGLFWKIKLHK